ncbi:MAG: amino acid adenylation domain-containing protein, partial [Chitinophagaceae bacterium]|nr:amino acid adenylation domain-containing protein [Chitinophagaceae bacterium]
MAAPAYSMYSRCCPAITIHWYSDTTINDHLFTMNKELIHRVFEQRAVASAGCIAISEPCGEIAYGDLNTDANRIASLLNTCQVRSGMVVAVLLPPGIRHAASLLGIFKSGSVYMPLEESFSGSRLQQMFAQNNCDTVITLADNLVWLKQQFEEFFIYPKNIIILPPAANLLSKDLGLPGLENIAVSEVPIRLLSIQQDANSYDETSILLSSFPSSNPEIEVTGESPNYIFYTSGSTGNGKGIVGSHKSLSHYIHWHASEWNVVEGVRISQIAPLSFDASLKDILVALIGGATLCVPDKFVKENMELLSSWVAEQRITIMQTVPSLFRLLTRCIREKGTALPDLKYVVLAGERLYGKDILNWRMAAGNSSRISNLYGLTETTILKCFYHVNGNDFTAGEVIPVGRPIDQASILVINDDTICDEGEIGEVYIKSPHVSKGYLEEELNKNLFVVNPLSRETSEIICRTGDLGRYRPDGNLEILGRQDEQLKISGVRVELDEVRRGVLSIPGIEQTELLVHQDDEYNQVLICYYLGTEQSTEWLRLQSGKLLNRQLIPSHFVWLPEFPLNTNGKVDRKALPRPEQLLRSSGYEAPSGIIEELLVEIWRQLLGIRVPIGRKDSFFSMGGSSLKAIQLISRLYKEFDVRVTIADIFNHPSLQSMAGLIAPGKVRVFTPITPVPDAVHYSLSSAQRRLWVLDQLNDGMTAYSRPVAYTLQGKLDQEALRKSVRSVVERHEILRTVFRDVDGEPRQFIIPASATMPFLYFEDLRATENSREQLDKKIKGIAAVSYQLDQGPLFNIYIFQTGDDLFDLVLSIHHIISDEWSMQVLIKEIITLYNAYSNNEEVQLPVLPVQYRDYAAWQQDNLIEGEALPHKDYWLNKLGGELPLLQLPLDSVRPPVQTYNGSQLKILIGEIKSGELIALCEMQGATLFMGLTALVKTLLYRYTGQEDIVIGTPVAGREHPDLDGQIGFYVNTLALRSNIQGGKGFADLLHEVKATTLGALEHQLYPFDRLVDELNLSRDLSRSPVFDVAIVLQNVQVEAGDQVLLNGLEIAQSPVEVTTSLYDLTFWFTQQEGGIVLNLEYNSDLFRSGRIMRMLQHFEGLLNSVLSNPAKPLQLLDYINDEEREQIISLFNQTTSYYPADKTLVDLFERQAMERGMITVLKCGDKGLSFAEINNQSNKLAHYLREVCGAGPDQLIGLLMERSEWLVIGILGILKSGAAYVPIDPSYPKERIQYILEDSLATVLVTDQQGWSTDFTCIDPANPILHAYPTKNPVHILQAQHLAYVIYTSGSTGRPKGVMIEHRSVINFLYNMLEVLAVTPMDRWLAVTTYSFDISVLEIFAPLISGATLLLADSETTANPMAMLSLMENEEPTIMQATPSFWSLITDAGWAGDNNLKLLVGGEALPVSLGQKLRELCGSMVNLYGPTETTIWSTYKRINTDADCLTIGVPIANTRLYILDKHLQLLPKGIPGQLYIAGDGLARGYYQRPDLTEEKFIMNPFMPAERMYNTGDQCCWTDNGEVKYMGRTDFMVKLRGYRIEMGEIEQALLENKSLQEAVVVLVENNGDPCLAAYFTSTFNQEPETLARELRQRLPEYMIPSYFIQLTKLPVNSNGKTDRKALPAPERYLTDSFVAPRNQTEVLLSEIWKEILGREKAGAFDHFFYSGGHSLRAIQVLSRIYKVFSVQLELRDIFTYPVLADLASFIDQSAQAEYKPLEKIPDQPYYVLSHSQQRLWLLDKIEGTSNTYVIPISYHLRGPLNPDALQQSFDVLIDRHEILRTVITEVDGYPMQLVLPAGKLNFNAGLTDLRGKEFPEQMAQAEGLAYVMESFQLDQAPLMRAHVWQTDEQEYLFFLGIHHIITDDWSTQILIREVLDTYNAIVTGSINPQLPLQLQYRDYAAWQRSEMTGVRLNFHRSYWINKLGDEIPVLDLPTDFPRPPVKTYNGAQVKYEVPAILVDRLRTICDENNATLFMGFTSLLYILLYRYSRNTDIIIGTPVAGRDHPDLENQLGFFVNNLALRNQVNPAEGFTSLLATVKQNLLEALKHQAYPFDQLVEDLNVVRDSSHSPIFDVLINWQNAVEDQLKGRQAMDLQVEENVFQSGVTKTDISFLLREPQLAEENLIVTIEYNTDIFSAYRMDNMARHFEVLLDSITGNPLMPVAGLSISGSVERALLESFNQNAFDFPQDETLISLFEKQAASSPDTIAIVFEGHSLSFFELNRRVNLMANHLVENAGLRQGQVAALLLERSEWMIISILAVLKAGAAYLPIDTSSPPERVQYLIKDSGAVLLITESHQLLNLPDTGTSFFIVDIQFDTLTGSESNPALTAQPRDVAYIIYTSGSTGEPKGVMVEHYSCVNMIWNERSVFAINSDDRILQFSSLSFDASVAEIFLAILSGVTLVITPSGLVKDSQGLLNYMRTHGVTMAIWPTAYLNSIDVEEIRFLRKLITAGDVANPVDAILCSEFLYYFNCYGPTEGTVWSTYFKVDHSVHAGLKRLPIGKPIGNVSIYIMNEAFQLQPIGVPGELCIG